MTRFSKKAKQDWSVGSVVRVGFMTLTVVRKVATPGDYRPDVYQLLSNGKQYTFQPHYGLTAGWDVISEAA